MHPLPKYKTTDSLQLSVPAESPPFAGLGGNQGTAVDIYLFAPY